MHICTYAHMHMRMYSSRLRECACRCVHAGPIRCGECGGHGCSQRPGGARACCAADISKTEHTCMHACMHACTHARTHAYRLTCMHAFVRACRCGGHLEDGQAVLDNSRPTVCPVPCTLIPTSLGAGRCQCHGQCHTYKGAQPHTWHDAWRCAPRHALESQHPQHQREIARQ